MVTVRRLPFAPQKFQSYVKKDTGKKCLTASDNVGLHDHYVVAKFAKLVVFSVFIVRYFIRHCSIVWQRVFIFLVVCRVAVVGCRIIRNVKH